MYSVYSYIICQTNLNKLIFLSDDITKTRLYNFDPLKPHFYIVKLGFTGVYIIVSYFCSKTIYVLSRNMKNIQIFIWKLSVFGDEIVNIFE